MESELLETVRFSGVLFNPGAHCMRQYAGPIAGPLLEQPCDRCGQPYAVHYLRRGVFTVQAGPAEDVLVRWIATAVAASDKIATPFEYEIRLERGPSARERAERALNAVEISLQQRDEISAAVKRLEQLGPHWNCRCSPVEGPKEGGLAS